jgi:hypothetical protein
MRDLKQVWHAGPKTSWAVAQHVKFIFTFGHELYKPKKTHVWQVINFLILEVKNYFDC